MSDLHSTLADARTLLFVPGSRPDRFPKAASSGADGIVIDLEDAVAPEDKDEARENARRWLASGAEALVRINSVNSPWYAKDLTALQSRPICVMLPKADNARQVTELAENLPATSCIVPIIETASGVLNAHSICLVGGVARLAFGNGDLASQLGIHHASREGLAFARSALILASAAARLPPPLDGVTTELRDESALVADAEHAAELGFTGKLCIHPDQVTTIHRMLTPTESELRWARQVVAIASRESVTVVEGQMVDKPVIERAQRLLSRQHVGTRSVEQ